MEMWLDGHSEPEYCMSLMCRVELSMLSFKRGVCGG